jgi:hypothetical protein
MANWMWGTALTAMVWFLAMVGAAGATVFRSRQWDAAFREIAVWELQRRGFSDRKWSLAEEKAVCLMFGKTPTIAGDNGMPFEGLILSAFAVLSGYGDRRELAALLIARREVLLSEALERQLRRAARFWTARWASRAWIAQKWFSRLHVAFRGIAWLLPRSLNEIAAIVKEYSTKLGVVAVFAGAVYWVAIDDQEGIRASGPDIVGFLAGLVLPSLVCWAMAVLLFRILVAFAGPPKNWSRRGLLVVGLTVAISVGLILVSEIASTGFALIEPRWLAQVDFAEPITHRITAAMLAMGFVWMAYKSALRALDRFRRASDRIGALGICAMVLGFAIPLAGMAASGTALPALRTAMLASIAVSLAMVAVSSGWRACEWIDRYVRLARDGVSVPRRGFSWQLIAVWVLSMAMLGVQAVLPTNVRKSSLGLALEIPPLLAILGMIPLAVISVLFVRRVNTYFERHTTEQWPEW